MIHLTLPPSFGTNTIGGIVFDKIISNCANDRKAIVEALKQGFIFQIGFRKVHELPFISSEAGKFIDFAEREYGVKVDVTFV